MALSTIIDYFCMRHRLAGFPIGYPYLSLFIGQIPMVGNQSADMDREGRTQTSLGSYSALVKPGCGDTDAQKGVELGITVRTAQIEGLGLHQTSQGAVVRSGGIGLCRYLHRRAFALVEVHGQPFDMLIREL